MGRGKQNTAKKAYKNRSERNHKYYLKVKSQKKNKSIKFKKKKKQIRVRDYGLEYAERKFKHIGKLNPTWSRERTEKQKLKRALRRSEDKISNIISDIQTSPPLEKKRRILDQDGQYNSQDMDDVNVRATYASFKVLSEHHKAEGGKKCTLVKRQVFLYNTFFNNHYLLLKININN
jgi:hypothetical protein